ncbi:hypothetical protein GE09DRAFT_1052431 [Coniochaeta sp. 2T2.1]|nr:hypothetical protein GE09DRAFT_1052431 [Coniochaeta sp. 2T2.1]
MDSSAPAQGPVSRSTLWMDEQIRFVLNQGPRLTAADIIERYNKHFWGISTMNYNQYRHIRHKYGKNPAYSDAAARAIANPGGEPTAEANQVMSGMAEDINPQRGGNTDFHQGGNIDLQQEEARGMVHDVGSTYHTGTHEDCPIDAQHQHHPDGTLKFPNTNAMDTAISRTGQHGRQFVEPSEDDTVNQKDLLVIYKPMHSGDDDAGSRADGSLQVNFVTSDSGWYTLGQYAQGPKPTADWRKNATSYRGIQIREAPHIEAAAPNSILRKPTGVSQRWGRRLHGRKGLYEMTLGGDDANYAPLSGYFFRMNPNLGLEVDAFGSGVLVNTSYLHMDGTSGYNSRLWSSQGTNTDPASVWAITGPIDDAVYGDSITSPGSSPGFMFHSTGSVDRFSQNGFNDAPEETPWQLDFSRVTVLDDKFLAGLDV